MKTQPIYLYAYLSILALTLGCDPREDAKQPVACFDFNPTTEIYPGDEVTFTNCSTDAETFEWDFDDDETSVAQNPTHTFEEAGTFKVKLIVTNKNLKDEVIHDVIVLSNVEACFSMSPNPAVVGQNVTFTNCSTNADAYDWDADGNGSIDSHDANPVFYFNAAGVYTVKLIAWAGSSSDEITHQLTITEETIEIDPTDYDGIPGWNTLLFDDFSSASDNWYQGTGATYQAYISGGFYTFIDTDPSETNYGRYYYTNAITLPDGNYDFEASIRNTDDNGNYGSGLIYGLDPDLGFNYYKFTSGYFNIGNTNGTWSDWSETSSGQIQNWNKLTVRRYMNNYYFFINEVYIYHYSYSSFGDQLGFIIDQDTHVDVDAVGVFEMDLTGKKSASSKLLVNTYPEGKGGNMKLSKMATPLKK